MAKYIMALDAGTTSNRCILFDREGNICSMAQKEFRQMFPNPGWVEHDANEIWSTQLGVAVEAMSKIGASAKDIAGIGITNQRETVIVWDKETGEPVYHAIVWQCRRTSEMADELKARGLEECFRAKTGTDHRRLFLRHKAQVDSRQCGGSQRAGGERRTSLRNRGDLADLEADQGQSACDRLLQRVADHAVLTSTH